MTNVVGLILETPSNQIAIETIDGRLYSYADLAFLSARYANVLRSRGVGPGDRVVAQIDKSISGMVLYLACLRSGAVYVPLNTAYTPVEVQYFIEDADPRLIVLASDRCGDLVSMIAKSARAVEYLDSDGNGTLADAANAAKDRFTDQISETDDLAAILYTSGTTGRSKGAMITHGNLVSNAQTLKEAWGFNAHDVLLHALPIYHAHGLFVGINMPLMAGAKLLFAPKFEADVIVKHLPRATSMMGVPTFYTRLLEQPELATAAKSIRLFISGSAPLLPQTHAAWSEKTGHSILERYGMTETQMNTSNPYAAARRPGSVGLPLKDIAVRVRDLKKGNILPAGEVGMIEVKGPNVFKGYWRMPDKTRGSFTDDGFFITGDLGIIDRDGYVFIVGRDKDLIITGGFNVYPKEIEIELDSIEGIVESAVVGLPDPDFGESVTAAIVPQAGIELVPDDILSRLRPRLAKFKLPKQIFFVPELPRNAMGKVQKVALREHLVTLGTAVS